MKIIFIPAIIILIFPSLLIADEEYFRPSNPEFINTFCMKKYGEGFTPTYVNRSDGLLSCQKYVKNAEKEQKEYISLKNSVKSKQNGENLIRAFLTGIENKYCTKGTGLDADKFAFGKKIYCISKTHRISIK